MPLTKDDLDAVKALAKAGRIEEARGLLASIDDERARGALIKFNERYPVPALESKSSVPEKTKIDQKGNRPNYGIWGVVAVTLIALGVVLWQVPSVRFAVYGAQPRLQTVCYGATWAIYGYDEFTDAQEIDGCSKAVEQAMKMNSAEIIYCLESSGQTDKRLEACLDEEGVYMTASYGLIILENEQK